MLLNASNILDLVEWPFHNYNVWRQSPQENI